MSAPDISNSTGRQVSFFPALPVMAIETFAHAIGLPVGVVEAAADRGYWPVVRVGRRRLINLEALRIAAARQAEEFSL